MISKNILSAGVLVVIDSSLVNGFGKTPMPVAIGELCVPVETKLIMFDVSEVQPERVTRVK